MASLKTCSTCKWWGKDADGVDIHVWTQRDGKWNYPKRARGCGIVGMPGSSDCFGATTLENCGCIHWLPHKSYEDAWKEHEAKYG